MPQSQQREPSVLKGIVLALVGFATFSCHDVLVKILHEYSVFQIIFFAMMFGYVPFSLARIFDARAISLHPKNFWLVFFRALFMVGGLVFAFLAFSLVPLVQAYVLLFTTPVLISLLAIPFLGEKIHATRGISIVMGLIGVIVVLRPTPDNFNLGHLCGIAAALSNSAAAIISRKIGNLEHSATLILTPLILNILVSGGMLYFVYIPMPLGDLALMFLIGILGLLAQLAILWGYRIAPAAVVAPMQYSQMIWAILFGYLFFSESIDRVAMLGVVITVLSGVMIVWRESQVSDNQPVLSTRNMRAGVTGPMPGSETDTEGET